MDYDKQTVFAKTGYTLPPQIPYPEVNIPTPELERVADRLKTLTETLYKASAVLSQARDTVFGARPETASNGKARPVSGSDRLGQISNAIDDLDEVACGLNAHAEQFARL